MLACIPGPPDHTTRNNKPNSILTGLIPGNDNWQDATVVVPLLLSTTERLVPVEHVRKTFLCEALLSLDFPFGSRYHVMHFIISSSHAGADGIAVQQSLPKHENARMPNNGTKSVTQNQIQQGKTFPHPCPALPHILDMSREASTQQS